MDITVVQRFFKPQCNFNHFLVRMQKRFPSPTELGLGLEPGIGLEYELGLELMSGPGVKVTIGIG